MRKRTLSVILFIIFFVAGYAGTCYLIPGFRLKLDAPPMIYLVKSLKHMVLIKSLIALVPAGIAAALPHIRLTR